MAIANPYRMNFRKCEFAKILVAKINDGSTLKRGSFAHFTLFLKTIFIVTYNKFAIRVFVQPITSQLNYLFLD